MAARRQHEGWNEVSFLAHGGHDRETVDARQHNIEHHDIERRGPKQVECGLSRIRDVHLVTLELEVEAQPVGQVLFVFHDQNAAHLEIGNWSTNVLPRPGPSLSAQARPPWRLATERTMKRPSPVPLVRSACAPGTR